MGLVFVINHISFNINCCTELKNLVQETQHFNFIHYAGDDEIWSDSFLWRQSESTSNLTSEWEKSKHRKANDSPQNSPVCLSSSRRGSVKGPDHSVDVFGSRSRLTHLFQKPDFVSGRVSRNRQTERTEESVHHFEVLSSRVDLMDEILQTDDSILTYRDIRQKWTMISVT